MYVYAYACYVQNLFAKFFMSLVSSRYSYVICHNVCFIRGPLGLFMTIGFVCEV